MAQAVRHDSMRARNLALVLGEVSRHGPITRAELADRTGLTKTTVSKLVGDLIENDMAVETGVVRDGERGRPGVGVRLSGARVAALGLEINVDYLAVCVMDLTRSVRLRRTRAADNRDSAPGPVAAALRAMAATALDEAAAAGLTVAGAILAVPGPVDPVRGLVHSAPNLGWAAVRPAELLDLPLPVDVDNEANLAAMGELWFGSGATDFLYVSGEIGIGAGIVVGGALFRGRHGFAGELGHVIVAPDGPACHCGGRGCLERFAGQDALLAAAGAADGVPGLIALLESGDERALTACAEAGRALGVALTSTVNLLDPGTIVLGGVFAPLFPWISGPAGEVLADRIARMRRDPPSLTVSRVGPDAATLGAAGQVIQRIIADPALRGRTGHDRR